LILGGKLFWDNTIKLGGSIITNKNKPFSYKKEIVKSIASQIKEFLRNKKEYRVVIGHGSGSFGHVIAKKHGFIHGKNEFRLPSLIEDEFFVEKLNKLVYESFYEMGLPVMVFSPGNFLFHSKNEFVVFEKPLLSAIDKGIIPIVYGDNVLTNKNEFYLLSTEDIFEILSRKIMPKKIIFVSDTLPYLIKNGIKEYLTKINKQVLKRIKEYENENFDVTGGMLQKLRSAINISKNAGAKVIIVNGNENSSLKDVLFGKKDIKCCVIS